MLQRLWNKYREMGSYIFFGIATTIVNWCVYSFGTTVIGLSMNASNVVAWILSVLFAYVTNKLFVFMSKDWNIKSVLDELTRFVGARIFTGILEFVGLPFLYFVGIKQSVFGIEGMLAKMIVSIVVIILNYIFSKFLVFSKANH